PEELPPDLVPEIIEPLRLASQADTALPPPAALVIPRRDRKTEAELLEELQRLPEVAIDNDAQQSMSTRLAHQAGRGSLSDDNLRQALPR
ncbi:hypothetical protein ABTL67_19505, partial [Acinetobacter baumannii]